MYSNYTSLVFFLLISHRFVQRYSDHAQLTLHDSVLVITINSYYSKVLSIRTAVFFGTVPVPRYYFSKVPSTGTAVLLRSAVPTTVENY